MFLRKFRSGAPEIIICGLGNPGQKYTFTRHNAGFMAVDTLAEGLGVKINRSRFDSLTAEVEIEGKKVLLMKPQTFMNLSGRACRQALDYYKLSAEDMTVVYDDVSLPVGRMRVRKKGSAGGHNGIKSILSELGSDVFPRLKLGVGEQQYPDLADWVLSRFAPDEQKIMDKVYPIAADALHAMVKSGPDEASGKFNGYEI
jgi:PTH1 family peptidyl-tRNA hydrolase